MSWVSAVSGGLGTLVRSVAGVVDALRNGEKFDTLKFCISLVQAVVLAGVTGWAVEDPAAAFASGYIGAAVLDKVGLQK